MSEETVLRALDIILERRHYPILMLCAQGTHRTSTVVGCLRKLQRWNLTSIFEEYRRYAGAKIRLLNEQFIELFDTDLVQKQYTPSPSFLSRLLTQQERPHMYRLPSAARGPRCGSRQKPVNNPRCACSPWRCLRRHSTVVSWLSPPARASGGDTSPPTHPQPAGTIEAGGGQEMITPRGAHPASPPLGSSPEALRLT